MPPSAFASGAHLLADQDRIVDLRRRDRLGEPGVERVAMLAELAHRAEHGDPPPGAGFARRALFSVAAIEAGLAL